VKYQLTFSAINGGTKPTMSTMLDTEVTLRPTSATMEEKADLAYRRMREALEDIYHSGDLGTAGSTHKVKIPFVMLTMAAELRDIEITINVSEKPAKVLALARTRNGRAKAQEREEEDE
jgi:hypothetical protein